MTLRQTEKRKIEPTGAFSFPAYRFIGHLHFPRAGRTLPDSTEMPIAALPI